MLYVQGGRHALRVNYDSALVKFSSNANSSDVSIINYGYLPEVLVTILCFFSWDALRRAMDIGHICLFSFSRFLSALTKNWYFFLGHHPISSVGGLSLFFYRKNVFKKVSHTKVPSEFAMKRFCCSKYLNTIRCPRVVALCGVF